MVVPGAPIVHRTGDTEIRYRPDSDLWYLTGFAEPGALLVLRGFADEDRSVLFVRPRDEAAERWTGPRLGPDAAAGLVGVDRARSSEELRDALPGLLAGADRVHYRFGANLGGANLGATPDLNELVVRSLATARAKRRTEGKGPRGTVDPGEILDPLRLRKDEDEIRAIREAAAITVEGMREGLRHVKPGAGEWEIEAAIESSFRRGGADGAAFPTIVGSGPNACTLHYVENSRRMEAGELLLVDAGAERRMYSGDATRTVPVSGAFSAEQAALYEIVESARRVGVATAAPGTAIAAVHQAALGALVDGLIEIGVLRGTAEALVERGEHKRYFPHQTSHWLGLDTHDVGDYNRDGVSQILEPGMVLTVEPGLYFPTDDGSRFRGIGIRIEDDVLVTAGGREVLTAALPTALHELAR